jgi:type II secretory pathway pseudopilin PulG
MPMKARNESGFTMIMTVIAVTLVALVAAVAVTAVNGNAQQSARGQDRQQAYEAALAGIHEYQFHLHWNNAYWEKCAGAIKSGEPNALNEIGSTANRRTVPGAGSSYALEIIPATGHTKCDPTNLETATASMIESRGSSRGTFRIRSNGFDNGTKVRVTATFKPKSFLEYVYFTQLETSDPVTYGKPELIKAANAQCSKTIFEGRYTTPLKNEAGEYLTESGKTTKELEKARYCDAISFIGNDNVKGPMHTNDAFVICEKPTLGRTANDPIEVSYPKSPGWFSTSEIAHSGSSCSGSKSNFKGTFQVAVPALVPPATNSALEQEVEPTFHFTGEIKVCLEGTTMKVGSGRSCTEKPIYSGPLPANGIIYDSNGTCTGEYTPFNVSYEGTTASTCGTINLEGKYSKPLTIAAANDVMIMNNLEKTNEEGMLGVVANNFIRVYHPVELSTSESCTGSGTSRVCEKVTTCGANKTGSVKNLKIEAALLAINHSFIVDNYKCGSQLSTLTVKGAIAQKYRGAVGTTGSTGYVKNYEYDERFKTLEPPSFIEPEKSEWVIGKQIVE